MGGREGMELTGNKEMVITSYSCSGRLISLAKGRIDLCSYTVSDE